MTKLSDLLTEADRAAIREPIASARTFPRRAFIDDEYFEFEGEHVLKNSWFAVSFSVLLPNTGDLKVMTVLGTPLILVRGNDDRIRAFHNVCPYDSCEVSIDDQLGLDEIIAPYHGWKYSLEGKLTEANYWDGTPVAENVSLKTLNSDLIEIPCTQWLSTLFVYLGKNPVPFEHQFQPVIDHFQKLDLERLTIGTDKDGGPLIHSLPIQSNWKTVYENYSPNVYHESFVHEMYRKSPHSPRVDDEGSKTYTEINDPSGFLGLCYDNEIGDSLYGETRLPKIRNIDGSANKVNTIANVFPNWVTTVLGDAARLSIFLPTGPGQGTQWVATFFDRDGAYDSELVVDRMQSARKGIQARKEDNLICESIQRARQSPAVNTQYYSPFWDAMHYTLTNLILDCLEREEK